MKLESSIQLTVFVMLRIQRDSNVDALNKTLMRSMKMLVAHDNFRLFVVLNDVKYSVAPHQII